MGVPGAAGADLRRRLYEETMTPDQKEDYRNALSNPLEWLAKMEKKREEKEERGPTKPRAPGPEVQAKRLRIHAKQRKMWTAMYQDRAPTLDGVIASVLGSGYDFSRDYPGRRLLLGREPYEYDEMLFMHKTIGSDTDDHEYMKLLDKHYRKYPYQLFNSPAVCKWFLCDRRVPPSGDIAGIDALYEQQLRLEAENADIERARAAARDVVDRIQRHRAKTFLAAYEEAAARGEAPDPRAVWEGFRPRRAQWIQDIVDDGDAKWGFSFYKSAEAAARADGLRRYLEIFDGTHDDYTGTNFASCKSEIFRMHDHDDIRRRAHADWVDAMPSEEESNAIRRHFREYRESSLHLPRILRNTFFVVTSDCIHPRLDHHDIQPIELPKRPGEDWHRLAPRIPGTLLPEEIDPVYVWAYDADWEPPAGARADDDGYEGRVRVRLPSVYTWFYYARKDSGYDMKELWKKAQRHPRRYWECGNDELDPSRPRELV